MQARVDWVRGLMAAGMMIAFGGLVDSALTFGLEPGLRMVVWACAFMACVVVYGCSERLTR